MNQVSLPPWDLFGTGYIFILKKNKPDNYYGLSTLIIADYEKSNVGAYQELIFIPGKVNTDLGYKYTIKKIYVSSDISIFNGKRNWGIPKEKANINFTNIYKGNERINANIDKNRFFDISIKSGKAIFPINTIFYPLEIFQEFGNKKFFTKPKGKGIAKLCNIKSINHINGNYFPDISSYKLLFGLKILNLELLFPKPIIK